MTKLKTVAMMSVTLPHTKPIDAVSEKIQAIGQSSYLQISTVILLISLAAWTVGFKVTTENMINNLRESDDRTNAALNDLRASLPSRDWLELKFANLEEQIGGNKKIGK